MERTITIEDTLQENVDNAIEETKEALLAYLKENPELDECPCLFNDIDYNGTFHEIVGGCVPIYTSEIEATWYLYANELEEAYENHGFGDNPRENSGMTAIYCYIYDQVVEWWNDNAEEIFEEWKEEQDEE
jgi:hypothetical protein